MGVNQTNIVWIGAGSIYLKQTQKDLCERVGVMGNYGEQNCWKKLLEL